MSVAHYNLHGTLQAKWSSAVFTQTATCVLSLAGSPDVTNLPEIILSSCAGNAEELKTLASTNDAPDLARLLYWLMVVAYNMRTLEVRFDVEQSMML